MTGANAPRTTGLVATFKEEETRYTSTSLARLDRSQVEPADEADELPILDDPDVPFVKATLKEAKDTEPYTDFAEPDLRPASSVAFARAAITELLPRKVRRAIERGEPLVVLIETQTPSWVVPVVLAASEFWPNTRRVYVNKAPSRFDQPVTLAADRPVIAVFNNPAWLPPGYVDAADVRVRLRLTPKIVREGLRLALGRGAAVTPRDFTGLDLPDLVMAVRPRSGAAAAVRRMRRTAERRITGRAYDTTPTLDQLKGYGRATAEIELIAGEARDWIAADAAGAPPPSILLHGSPGTGKTMVAKSIARTLGLPIVITSVSEWFSRTDGNLGDVAKAAQTFFDRLATTAPAVGFLDELDALPDRARLSDRGRDWWAPIVTGVLLMIDRVRAERPSVILIGATNHIDRLDEALKRPGRFDRHIEIRPPETAEELSDILRHHLGDDLRHQDIAGAARLGIGATGAEAEAWVKQARQRARAACRPMTLADLIEVIAPSDATPPELRRAIALHEAAHAVVGLALGRSLESVSIVSKGSMGGVTIFAPGSRVLSRDDLERQVMTTLAGRAADILLSGGATTGASSDLRQATALVTAIHVSFGLADTLLARVPPERAEEALALDPELRRVVANDLDRLMQETMELVATREAEVRALADVLLKQRCVMGGAVVEGRER
ncbi:AAA family ATPase [Chelatococcus sambhunathii]|uniref:AAA family ATPase n=1 Tax=Chelatococcus sambhunathii TaxID=363953 RepID=A0ABU1DGJ7_9HYPH|nr:AAA family ATPase [Chelatococcus sambhunathii]MDR4307176.1 AAA family ATPase [Chelatococcus sambhunathii]